MPEDIEHLTDTGVGSYEVMTISSSYLIDLDARTLVRRTGDLANVLGVLDTPQSLERIEVCSIGKRARFHVRLDDDPIPQPITTMIVLDISQAGADHRTPQGHEMAAPDGVTWTTVGGEGELVAWDHLTLLGMMLLAGLAGDRLRLRRGDAVVDIELPAPPQVSMTYSHGEVKRNIQVPFMATALRATRRWLSNPPPSRRGTQP